MGPTDRPTDGRTDGRTDIPSYRDARTHLKVPLPPLPLPLPLPLPKRWRKLQQQQQRRWQLQQPNRFQTCLSFCDSCSLALRSDSIFFLAASSSTRRTLRLSASRRSASNFSMWAGVRIPCTWRKWHRKRMSRSSDDDDKMIIMILTMMMRMMMIDGRMMIMMTALRCRWHYMT